VHTESGIKYSPGFRSKVTFLGKAIFYDTVCSTMTATSAHILYHMYNLHLTSNNHRWAHKTSRVLKSRKEYFVIASAINLLQGRILEALI